MSDKESEEFATWADNWAYGKNPIARHDAWVGYQARQQEINELKGAYEGCVGACNMNKAVINRLSDLNDALNAEIERLKIQAAKFRSYQAAFEFLRNNFVRCEPDMSGNHHWMSKGRLIGRGNTFEEAIDNVMKEKS